MYARAKASEIVRWFQTENEAYRFARCFVSATFAARCGQSFPQPVHKYRCTPGTPPVPVAQDYAFARVLRDPRVFVAATFRWALLPSSSVGFSLRQRNDMLSRSNACPGRDCVLLFSP